MTSLDGGQTLNVPNDRGLRPRRTYYNNAAQLLATSIVIIKYAVRALASTQYRFSAAEAGRGHLATRPCDL